MYRKRIKVAVATEAAAAFLQHRRGCSRVTALRVQWLITGRTSALPSCYHLEVIQRVDALTYMTNFLSQSHMSLRTVLIKLKGIFTEMLDNI